MDIRLYLIWAACGIFLVGFLLGHWMGYRQAIRDRREPWDV